jgi:hypothetical protein
MTSDHQSVNNTSAGDSLYALVNTDPQQGTDCPLPIIQKVESLEDSLWKGELAVFQSRDAAEAELATHHEYGNEHIQMAELTVDEFVED